MTEPWATAKREWAARLLAALYEQRLLQTWLRDRSQGWELVSGLWSPFYVSMRSIPSRPALFRLTVEAAAALIRNEAPQANRLIGIAMTGIPIAGAAGYALDLPMGFTRKLPDVRTLADLDRTVPAWGSHRLVESDFGPGDRVLLFDDVVSHFDSKEVALRQLELELEHRGVPDVRVEGVAVLVNRGRDARARARAIGLSLVELVSLHSADVELLEGVAHEREVAVIGDYIRDYERYQDPDVQAGLRREAERFRASGPAD